MDDGIVSKTKRKQEMTALQTLGARLVDLPESQIAELPMEENLREAVLEAKRITSHEAKRRQMQYVGRLMREIDPAALRERLLGDDEALTAFAAEHPDADLQALRTLIRNTRKEQKAAKPPRSYRELFRLIKECSDSSPS